MHRAGFPFTLAGADLLRAHKERYRSLFDFELQFDALNQMGVMALLWQFILPKVPFDVNRWHQLANQRLALAYRDYIDHPRETTAFLHFLANEGEADLLQGKVGG